MVYVFLYHNSNPFLEEIDSMKCVVLSLPDHVQSTSDHLSQCLNSVESQVQDLVERVSVSFVDRILFFYI